MARIGLMGCGKVAMYGHLPAIVRTPGLELVAVFDPAEANARRASEQFGGTPFTEEQAFWDAGIDAVVITSPAPVHPANVAQAAKHGKHVLCEKPLAMTEPQIEQMVAAMDQAGLMFFTGFTYRFSPSALRIKQLVDERAVGDIRSLRLIYVWSMHGKWQSDERGERVINARREGRMQEGGPMVDCGVHQIDLARWWIGSEVVRHRGVGAWVEEYEAPDHVYLHMDHADGVHTMVEMSYTYTHTAAEPQYQFTYELIGSEGLIRYDRGTESLTVFGERGTEQLPHHPEKNFGGMYEAFAQALATGQAGNLPTAADGLVATRIARSATEQAIAERIRS